MAKRTKARSRSTLEERLANLDNKKKRLELQLQIRNLKQQFSKGKK